MRKSKKLKIKFAAICKDKGIEINTIAEGAHIRMYGGHAPDPLDDMYRNIPAFSNSRLGQIKETLQGKIKRKLPFEAFEFGKIVHQQLLEQEKCELNEYYLTTAKLRDIKIVIAKGRKEMIQSGIWDESDWKKKKGEFEKTIIWKDRITGLICKAKIDIYNKNEITDIKTTRATTKEEFIKASKKYGIDRQAAFYMDGAKVNKFNIIGLQKQKPYNVYRLTWTKRMKIIDEARKKYRFILNKAKEFELNP